MPSPSRSARGALLLASAALAPAAVAAPASAETTSFTDQGCSTWTVPAGVSSVQVLAAGQAGANGRRGTGAGGRGARATADVAVSKSQSLQVCVGVGGGWTRDEGNRGGGASGIALGDFSVPLLIAGGGGGAADADGANAAGGDAGVPDGKLGGGTGGIGGGGGTQTAAGAGGSSGGGAIGYPGPGGETTADGIGGGGGGGYSFGGSDAGGAGAVLLAGGGGGGYFGGGGGGTATGSGAGGGGGGSSFCANARAGVSDCVFALEDGSAGVTNEGTPRVVLSYSVVTDTTPPVIEPTVSGTVGNAGWYTSDASLSWDVSDPDSDITSTTGCESRDFTQDTGPNGVDVSCRAESAGGPKIASIRIKRDATPPTLTITGGPQDGQSYTVGSVPAGPSCSASDAASGVDEDCAVTGYSTAIGEHTLTFRATDVAGNAKEQSVSYTVVGVKPSISGSAPGVTAGADYSFAYTVAGEPAATVSLASGTLPPGITLDEFGQLSGRSTAAGTYAFTVKASNALGDAVSGPQSITVAPAAPEELTYSSGDGQAAAIGAAFSKALNVVVRDVYGNPIPGVPVKFAVVSGSASLGGTASRTANSNASGFAAAALTAGKTAGPVRVDATLPAFPSVPAVVYTETVRAANTSKADLAVTLSGVPAQIEVGQTFTVTVKVKNNGPQAATSVRTVLDPGQGLDVVGATGGTIAPLATAASWTASSLAKGATLTYTARIKAAFRPWCGTARVRGTSLSSTTDPSLSNNVPAPLVKIVEPSTGVS